VKRKQRGYYGLSWSTGEAIVVILMCSWFGWAFWEIIFWLTSHITVSFK
jgi:hypothetical protein